MHTHRGVSLVELLVTLAVVVAAVSIAVPELGALVSTRRADVSLQQVLIGVQFARHAAISLGAPVSYCPSADATTCSARDTWHQGAIVFVDRDRSGDRDIDETLLRGFPEIDADGRIEWRSFRRRAYLTFEPSGFTSWQNGNFRFCPASGEPRLIRAAIVNPQGRVRRAPDTDGDGVPEDANGRPYTCGLR
jgi:type IV fimbrial biogenesis protein FimT